MAAPPVGAYVATVVVLDAAAIRAGADLIGDHNPLHHDGAVAALSRYGGIIASGAHTSALLAGLVTRGFGMEAEDGRGAVGVDYHVQFLAAVHVGRSIRLEWTVVAHETRRSGTRARMEGRIVDLTDGAIVLQAEMTVLYFG